MCQDVNDKRLEPIGLLDVSISRNGYGRQIHSSKKKIHVSIDQENKMEIATTFIRAPIIQHIGKNIDIIEKNDNYLKMMNIAFLKLVANLLDIPFTENEDFITKLKKY